MASTESVLIRQMRAMIVEQKIITEQMQHTLTQADKLKEMVKHQKQSILDLELKLDELARENTLKTDLLLIVPHDISQAQVPIIRNLHETINMEKELTTYNWQGSIEMEMANGEFTLMITGKASLASGTPEMVDSVIPMIGEVTLTNLTPPKALMTMSFRINQHGVTSLRKPSVDAVAAGFNTKLVITTKQSVQVRQMKLTYKNSRVLKSMTAQMIGDVKFHGGSVTMVMVTQ